MRKQPPPVPDTTSVINEAQEQFGSVCYLIDDQGVSYGPEPIDWKAHYDFNRGRWWCDARVRFGAPAGMYSGYRTAAPSGSTRQLNTFQRPVLAAFTDSIMVNLTTR
jgi:hypothetical protein